MAKSVKKGLGVSDLRKRALAILQKRMKSKKVILGPVEDRSLANGQVVRVFRGTLPNSDLSSAELLHLNEEGQEVNIEKLTEGDTANLNSAISFLETLVVNNKDAQKRCESLSDELDYHLLNLCEQKHNFLKPCKETGDCRPTFPTGKNRKVDLVILIDTSGSMSSKGAAISDAATIALRKVDCPTDLRIVWLGIAGTFSGTRFDTTSRDYLLNYGTCSSLTTPDPGSHSSHAEREEGARTITDLANCFDWREGACRSIFYISDEAIHRGNTENVNAVNLATQHAITAAVANQVTVFAHYIKQPTSVPPIPYDEKNYLDICQATGGIAFINAVSSQAQYIQLLNEAICNACGTCKTIDWTNVKPCVSVSWGDSDCDCIETDDFEVLCINIYNGYENLVFEEVKVNYLIVTHKDGSPVSRLPDGSPAVEIIPVGPLCFGDLTPCKRGQPTVVSRQVVLRTRGAASGSYLIKIGGLCYKASSVFSDEACFELTLCKD